MDYSNKTKEELIKELEILKQNQENISLVLNNIKEMFYQISFDENGNKKFEYLSSQIEEVLGLSKKEYIENQDKLFEYFHPNDIDELTKIVTNSKKEKTSRTIQYRFFNKKLNKYVWIEESFISTYNEKGKLKSIFGSAKNVTEKIDATTQKEFILENIEEVIYNVKFDPKNNTKELVFISPQIKQLVGLTKEEFAKEGISGKLKKRIHPDDLNIINLSTKSLYDNKKTKINNQFRLKPKGKDEYIWIDETLNAKYDKEGNLSEIITVLRDITESKLLSDKIKVSEKSYKDLLNNSPDLIYMINDKGQFIDVNSTVINVLGYKKEELIGKTPAYFSNKKKNDINEIPELIKKAKRKTQYFDWWIIDKKGKESLHEIILRKGMYLGKNVLVATGRNITERIEYQNKLKNNQEKLNLVLENIKEGIYSVDFTDNKNRRFDYSNAQLKKILGKNLDDFVKISWEEKKQFYHPDDISKIEKASKEIFTNKEKPITVEYRFKKKTDKDYSWLEEKIVSKFDEKGKLLTNFGVIRDISKQKVAELHLKEKEELYRNLFTKNLAGVFITENGIIIECNNSFAKYFGYKSRIELIGKKAEILYFAKDDRNKYIQDLYKYEYLTNYRLRQKRKDGLELWVLTNVSMVNKQTKRIEGTLIEITDQLKREQLEKEKLRLQLFEESNKSLQKEIAERKVIEQQLIQNQKYTSSIINSSLDIICASDNKGKITEYNKAAQKAFGYTKKEIKNKHISNVYAYKDEYKNVTYQLSKKGVYAGEITNINKKGEKFTSFLSASVLKNEKGEVIGTMGVSRDITEMKKAEQQTKQQAAKLQSIIENSSHLFWTYHKTLGLTSYNQNYYKSFVDCHGKEPRINDTNLFENNSELDVFWAEKNHEVFKGKKMEFITERKNKKGQLSIKEVFLSPIFNDDGSVSEVSGMAHDITEKMIAEKELKNSLKEKEILLKEVHHRVKNNLQVISSILNLQSSYIHDEKILTILKESQNRIKSMAFIHESLYQTNDFSQINFSEYVVNLSKNLVHSYLVNNELIELKLDINKVSLNLDLSIPCGLIINELVSNALKYAFPENRKNEGYILISLKTNKENVYLSISDNGVGLPKNLDFRNTESLGLQLVTTLVEQINGTITQENTIGTTYNIIFKHIQ